MAVQEDDISVNDDLLILLPLEATVVTTTRLFPVTDATIRLFPDVPAERVYPVVI